jgi:hypothetical protein
VECGYLAGGGDFGSVARQIVCQHAGSLALVLIPSYLPLQPTMQYRILFTTLSQFFRSCYYFVLKATELWSNYVHCESLVLTFHLNNPYIVPNVHQFAPC